MVIFPQKLSHKIGNHICWHERQAAGCQLPARNLLGKEFAGIGCAMPQSA